MNFEDEKGLQYIQHVFRPAERSIVGFHVIIVRRYLVLTEVHRRRVDFAVGLLQVERICSGVRDMLS